MKRSTRRFQPSLDALEMKTLLSAGQLAHPTAVHHHPRKPADGYYYFAKINNNTAVNNLTVSWAAWRYNSSGMPYVSNSGSVIAGTGVTPIGTAPGSSSQPPAYFVFTFTIKGNTTTTPNDYNTLSSTQQHPNLSGLLAQNLLPSGAHMRRRMC